MNIIQRRNAARAAALQAQRDAKNTLLTEVIEDKVDTIDEDPTLIVEQVADVKNNKKVAKKTTKKKKSLKNLLKKDK